MKFYDYETCLQLHKQHLQHAKSTTLSSTSSKAVGIMVFQKKKSMQH